MNIECLGCREILLYFERPYVVNGSCGHYLCDVCIGLLREFGTCDCGRKFSNLRRQNVYETIHIIIEHLKNLSEMGVDDQRYRILDSSRNKKCTKQRRVRMKQWFNDACCDLAEAMIAFQDYLQENNVPLGDLLLPVDRKKEAIVDQIIQSYEDVLDALAAFILENGYKIPGWLKRFFPTIVKFEEQLEDRADIYYHEYHLRI